MKFFWAVFSPALEGAGGLLVLLVALELLTGKAQEPTGEKRPG